MQLIQTKRVSRKKVYQRRALWLLLAGAVAAVWLAWNPAVQKYRHWKQQRALGQAKQFIEKHDATNAQVALDVALHAVPGSVEAWRVAADMLEQVGSLQALKLRRQIVQFAPDSTSDKAKLVLCALRFGDINTAREALSDMTPEQAVQPEALEAALAYAVSTSDAPVADTLFEQLKTVYPNNDDLKFAQASLRLRHPMPERVAEARASLEELAKNPKYTLRVHREFRNMALTKRDFPDARKWSTQVIADKGANLADRLNQANLDLLIEKMPFEDVLARIKPNVPATPADTAQFTRWMMVQGKFAEADKWLATLPEAVRNSHEVQDVQAEVTVGLRQWDRLAKLLEAGAWGPPAKDVVSIAMEARVISTRGTANLVHEMWDEALRAAGTNLPSLQILLRLSSIWSLNDETERTLWAIVRGFPEQNAAQQALFNFYRQRKNTAGMRNLMVTLRDLDPSRPRYQHDWALLSLLLEPTTQWSRPKDVMKGLYHDAPTNATYATGYAFALAQAGRGPEALAIIEKLSDVDRENPLRAPYLAYIYGVNRRRPEFDKFAAKEPALVDLLPEEHQLFATGRATVDRPLPRPAPPAKTDAKKSP